jgi:dihydropyrimidinase
MRVRGWPVTTIARGEVVWSDGEFDAAPGRGQFLACDHPQSVPAQIRQEA